MANNLNFTGWSGKTDFLSGGTFNLSTLNNSGRAESSPQTNSKIITGPVVIEKTPKNGPSRAQDSRPVLITGSTQQSVSNRRSLNTPLGVGAGVNVPFTAGTADYSFPSEGGWEVDGFNGAVYHIAVDADGKYVIGGGFTTYYNNSSAYTSNRLIRLNTDGTVDDTFNISFNEDCYGGGFNDTVYTLEIQSDGKILVGGAFTNFDRNGGCGTYNRIIRLNSDGSRDTTFNTGDGFNNDVYDIHVQPNGKILVGGDFYEYNGTVAYKIVRLNSNGSLDSSFLIGDDNVLFNNYVNVIELQSDGKILVGGYFTTYGNVSQNYITRLNTNGTLDTTFQIGNGFNDEVMTLALQSDGKIIVGGYFDSFDNNDLFSGKIVRLDSNGTLDTLFGHGLNNQVHSLAIQSDGKILVGGYFSVHIIDNDNVVYVHKLVRFNSDCSFDYSFYFDEETIFNDGVEYITILEDDNILVGGFFNNFDGPDPLIYPFNYFGRLLNSISVYPYTYTVEACAQPLMDETITYVVGSMTPLEFETTYSFQSLQNPSITVCGFIIDTYPSNIIDYVMVNTYINCDDAYISNYKLVTLEDCLFADTEQLFPVWVVDNKYNVGDILYVDIVLDGEGRYFSKFAAQITSIDETWDVPFPISSYLPAITYTTYSSCEEAIETNGLLYVALDCITEDAIFPLIHKSYNDNTSLLIPNGDNNVKTLVDYLPSGPSYLISGGTPEIYSTIEFTGSEIYDSLCEEGLSKISPKGVLNPFFLDGGFSGGQNGPLVYTTIEQPDGKILVGGNFEDYDGTTVNNFMRLNSDGTLDETFIVGGFNTDGYVRAIALQPDGKILVGGNFTDYDGYNVGRFIRLNSDGSNDETFTFSTEFNDTVRAIAVQRDGKIVVGGDFNYYYDFYCPQIVRLNSDGTPDSTFVMGEGFDGDQVFTITIETFRNDPYYVTNGPAIYTENIIVGGWFNWYNGTTVRGIVKLSPTGEVLPDFGEGFNVNEGSRPRVNKTLIQPDGKIVVIGGADGGELRDYNDTWIPENIVRLVKDSTGIYQIDDTFTTRNFDNGGGFSSGPQSITLLPNGKYMVGGYFNSYGDNNDNYDVPYLVRLNSDGTLDTTFTFDLDDSQVINTTLLSSGILLVGGRFNSPTSYLLELFIGDDYKLRTFTTCDGVVSNILLPTGYQLEYVGGGLMTATEIPYSPISTDGLDIVTQDSGGDDDNDFLIELPFDFDVNFLGVNYTSVWIGTNSYLTFGDGSTDYGIDPLPGDIPAETGLPGVYISTRENDGTCLDSSLVTLYTGTTDGGNTTIIRFEGNNNNSTDFPNEVTLIYNFKFYKDQSNYFDLIIEQNNVFCNDDPTGGISNGVDPTWVTSFDSSSEKSYRLGVSSVKPIKANVNERVAVCGTVGDVITTPKLNPNSTGIPGSMYFDGIDNESNMVTVDFNLAMDLDTSTPWTVEWFQYDTTSNSCCARIFSIGNYPTEFFAASIEFGSIIVWIMRGTPGELQYSYTLTDPTYNTWSHIAISAEDIGGGDRIIRVYQNGVQLGSNQTFNVDMNNFDGPTQYPLTIGAMGITGAEAFKGYITNFRWNKGTCYYNTGSFDVPTSPLPVDGSQLLLLATDQAGLTYDSSETQTVSSNNVTWSSLNPFASQLDFTLFTSTNTTSYGSCEECGQMFKTILYVRDGANPNYVLHTEMSPSSITNVLTNGPIFTRRGPECYEILKYTY